jgi:hypothetical protein
MQLHVAVGVADTTRRPIRERGRVLPLAGLGRVWFTAWMSGQPSVMIGAGDIELPRQ